MFLLYLTCCLEKCIDVRDKIRYVVMKKEISILIFCLVLSSFRERISNSLHERHSSFHNLNLSFICFFKLLKGPVFECFVDWKRKEHFIVVLCLNNIIRRNRFFRSSNIFCFNNLSLITRKVSLIQIRLSPIIQKRCLRVIISKHKLFLGDRLY